MVLPVFAETTDEVLAGMLLPVFAETTDAVIA